ncbi:YihY/virulence factor BrkB family protein [Corynebacterium sp. USCH3]|uniref:YihY/virulence factor BrkB family protein n=1 Tax=Corynebacterium sp. USCH3 TaxID=3024840 RepID=UPI0030B6F2AB
MNANTPQDQERSGDPADAPAPEDPRKADTPVELTSQSWKHVVRTTVRQFTVDECLDLAAGLTYRTVLSIFPALIAVVSILSLFGQDEESVTSLMDQAEGIIPADTWETVRPALESVLTAPAAGFGLVVGLVTALWSASGYVKAFGRAMNRIHEVPEGRGVVKVNVQMYLLTLVILALATVAVMVFVLSGPVAEQVGDAIGFGATALTVWGVAKWIILVAAVVFLVALLYYATPNVRQPKFRWVSIGALIAIVAVIVGSLVFFFYVTNFSSYNATYGALAGVIILLLWIYLMNVSLLFGAEIDSEIERARQLQAGIRAEEDLRLPARDTAASEKQDEKLEEDAARGRSLRRTRGESATSGPRHAAD